MTTKKPLALVNNKIKISSLGFDDQPQHPLADSLKVSLTAILIELNSDRIVAAVVVKQRLTMPINHQRGEDLSMLT